jgi:arsenate reductase
MSLPETDAELVLLHNPRCSKSRTARALLEERGVAFEIRAYLEEPLSRAELEGLATRLGLPASDFVRRGERAFAEAGCGPDSSDEDILAAMVAFPILIERPILVRGARAVVGRPPEQVFALLQAAGDRPIDGV